MMRVSAGNEGFCHMKTQAHSSSQLVAALAAACFAFALTLGAGTAFGLVLGMTGAAALLLLISVASSVMVVNV